MGSVILILMSAFSKDIVDAVLKHMNDDHTEDSLMIVRAFAEPLADEALMSGLDSEAGYWSVRIGEKTETARVAWSQPVTERAQIRREVVVLYTNACKALGVEPRQEH